MNAQVPLPCQFPVPCLALGISVSTRAVQFSKVKNWFIVIAQTGTGINATDSGKKPGAGDGSGESHPCRQGGSCNPEEDSC